MYYGNKSYGWVRKTGQDNVYSYNTTSYVQYPGHVILTDVKYTFMFYFKAKEVTKY